MTKITPAIIAAMSAGEKISDPETVGLLVVAGTRAKSFIYRYRDGDKIRQIKIGTFGPMTLSEARKQAAMLRGKRLEGKDPAGEKRAARARERASAVIPAGPTVGDLCRQYLDEHIDVERGAKSAAETRRLLTSPDLANLLARPAVDVERSEAVQLISNIAKRAPVVAGQTKSELRAAFEHAIDSGRVRVANPFAFRPKRSLAPQIRDRILSDAELKLLVPWMSNYSSSVRDALMLTLLCGIRSGEAVAIEAQEVEDGPDGMTITIPAGKSKNRDRFLITVPEPAAEIVRRRLKDHPAGWLFPGKDPRQHIAQKVLGVAIWARDPGNRLPRYANAEKCPVARWSPHDLRRTCRTNLSRLGCPVEIAEAILNHRPAGVRGKYDFYRFIPERRYWLGVWANHVVDLTR